MNIGIDIRYLEPEIPTGIGYYIISLLKEIAKYQNGYRYHLYYSWRRNSSDWIERNLGERFIPHKGYVPDFLSAKRFNRLWLEWYLPSRISKDAIHLFHGPSFFIPESDLPGKIVTIHDLSPVIYPDLYHAIVSDAIIERTRRSVMMADAVIADSDNTKNDIVKIYGVSEDKVHTIYLGINETFKSPVESEIVSKVEKKYRLPGNYILNVGSYHPRKNTKAIIRAMKILKDQGRPMHAVFTGKKTPYFEKLWELVCILHLQDSVICLEYVSEEEIRALHAGASMMVYPSYYEGFCLPVVEAMASGVPCIVSNAGCLPEIAGDSAIVVQSEDYDSIADAIRELTEDHEKRETLVARGYGRAKQFSWRDTASQTLALYRTVSEKKSNNGIKKSA